MTIRDLIAAAGLTQQEFAEITGISRVALVKLLQLGNLDRIVPAVKMLEVLVNDGRLPRGYTSSETEARKALVGKLKARLDSIVAS